MSTYKASLKASAKGLSIVDRARQKKGWTKTSIVWCDTANTSPATIKRFWRGIPIQQESFIDICQVVGINDWKKIAENIPEKEPHIDLGLAPDVRRFYGRQDDLTKLEKWLVQDRCRLVGLLGMGGIGKTTLAVKLAKQIEDNFDYVIFRSLQNSPPLAKLLDDWLKVFTDQSITDLPTNINESISQLIRCLQRYSCLLVLDHLEAILSSGDFAGNYREKYQIYGQLLKQIGEISHQSCLLLISREKPGEFALLEGDNSPVRSYQLEGLGQAAREIFKSKGLLEPEKWKILIHLYRGNPFILNIIAALISEVFDGRVSEFLKQGTTHVTRDISDFLDEQFERLSASEQQIISQVAKEPESVSRAQLQQNLSRMSETEVTNALLSLVRRSFLEKTAGRFALQPVLKEYVISLSYKRSKKD